MAIGRTFQQAWLKGFRALENDRCGWHSASSAEDDRLSDVEVSSIRAALRTPTPERAFQIYRALEAGLKVEEISSLTGIDPWFLNELAELIEAANRFQGSSGNESSAESSEPRPEPDAAELQHMKQLGFGDAELARLRGRTEAEMRDLRHRDGIRPVYRRVDTCAGEFPAATPYLYSTYETEDESARSERPKAIILGSGPNRIGQGIEFDYCCVSAALALRDEGFETIMVNSNPETVSTDFDISDKLYFEPLTLEDVLEIVEHEQPDGVVVQLGGQTPLGLARALDDLGVPILGTSVDSIDEAEDRRRFEALCQRLGIRTPEGGTATSIEDARAVAERIGYPVLVRPSYVLGGRAMEIVYDDASLAEYFDRAIRASPEHPVLLDRFLEDAFEADVDAIADGERVFIGGVMQHIEEAGVHSGDSACVVPPYLLRDEDIERMRRHTRELAEALDVRGLINVQYAVFEDDVYVLEVNPRASRTVPFISKAIGVPLARVAARVLAGRRLDDLNLPDRPVLLDMAVKEAVLPFDKFPEADPQLGPEMRSTGEVMGIADSFGLAFAKAQLSAGSSLPISGTLAITVHDRDKPNVTPIARRFHELGFEVRATEGTADYLGARGIPCGAALKLHEGRPNLLDLLLSGDLQLLINTPLGKHAQHDDYEIRRAAVARGVPYTTTLSAASAAADAITALRSRALSVCSLQDREKRREALRADLGASAAERVPT
jgi:carbamoyl-phosphate synthase large subunit